MPTWLKAAGIGVVAAGAAIVAGAFFSPKAQRHGAHHHVAPASIEPTGHQDAGPDNEEQLLHQGWH